jgi:NAD(P)H dehydrogenase (quinone)
LSKILVTGASGNLGRLTLLSLLKRRPASDLVGLVRDPARAEDLAALGIELRQGDYADPDSLERAFEGVDKLMLTATHAFTDRKTAHGNVIDAAVKTGVNHLVFMPIARKAGSDFAMKEITDEDLFTESRIVESGLTYTLAYHPPFLDAVGLYIGPNAQETGVRVPQGNGRFAAASREDLAEAHAAILTGEGHENKAYTLTGDPSVSFEEVAGLLTKIYGWDVPYEPLSEEEYLATKRSEGFPDFVVTFVLRWIEGMNAGEWQQQTGDLERLIGRKPKTAEEYLRADYGRSTDA